MKYSLVLLFLFSVLVFGFSQELSIKTEVSSREVYVGETLVLQITVNGNDQVSIKTLTRIGDFDAILTSASPSNSRSITIINGKRTDNIRKSYVFVYSLTAYEPGIKVIPPLEIEITGGGTYFSEEVSVNVLEAIKTDDFHLNIRLNKSKIWLGEPLVITTDWLWKEDYKPVSLNGFNHPVFKDDRFQFEHLEPTGQANNHVQLRVNSEKLVAQESYSAPFVYLSFNTELISSVSGVFQIPAATISFDAISGYEIVTDFFGREVRKEILDKFVIQSNEVTFEVLSLPDIEKPIGFSGLIGQFEISTSAEPKLLKVGDPIKLLVTIEGKGSVEGLEPPKIKSLTGFEDFRVGGQVLRDFSLVEEQNIVIFEYTVRALSNEVKAIPAIEISYFDSIQGGYSKLMSKSIPIQVEANRQVTLMDVEGSNKQNSFNMEVTSNITGISHNYRGDMLLQTHTANVLGLIKKPINQVITFLGPLSLIIAAVCSGIIKLGRIYSLRKVKAIEQFKKDCNRIVIRKSPNDNEIVVKIVRKYLEKRLNLSKLPNTYEDVDIHLKNAQAGTDLLQELKNFFVHYEKIQYSGKHLVSSIPLENVISMIERIDRSLVS